MNFVGCDIAKDTFEASLEGIPSRRFTNTPRGHAQLAGWIKAKSSAPVCVVLEATCVYHLPLANYLSEQGIGVLVANPTRASRFAESQGLRNKSDCLDTESLRRYGASLDLSRQRLYQPDRKIINQLKALLNRYTQLEKDLRRERNRLEKCPFIPDSEPQAQSLRRQISHIKAEIHHLERDIRVLIGSDQRLKHNRFAVRSAISRLRSTTSSGISESSSDPTSASSTMTGCYDPSPASARRRHAGCCRCCMTSASAARVSWQPSSA